MEALLGVGDLLQIFDHLSAQELLCCASLVNKRWAELALSDAAWQPRVNASDAAALRATNSTLSQLPLRRIYPVLQFNLLLNSTFERLRQTQDESGTCNRPWRVTLHRGQGWSWEPNGGEGISHLVNSALQYPPRAIGEPAAARGGPPCAVASSYQWCQLMQSVDLVDRLCHSGLSETEAIAFLDGSPPTAFSVFVGCREDCPATAEVMVVLDDGRQPLPEYVGYHPFPWDRSCSAAWHSEALHPETGSWNTVSAVLHGYPRGVRRVLVVLGGKDCRYWAGHYGAKFACAQLRFLPASEYSAAVDQHGTLRPVLPAQLPAA